MEIIGWIGAILFAACGIPQAWECYRTGNARGLAWGFLILWFFGEIFTVAYILPKWDLPLLFNYAVNFVVLAIIFRYKIWERKL